MSHDTISFGNFNVDAIEAVEAMVFGAQRDAEAQVTLRLDDGSKAVATMSYTRDFASLLRLIEVSGGVPASASFGGSVDLSSQPLRLRLTLRKHDRKIIRWDQLQRCREMHTFSTDPAHERSQCIFFHGHRHIDGKIGMHIDNKNRWWTVTAASDLPTEPSPSIDVVAGAIFDGTGKVLLGLRHMGKPRGGLWELPGGKVDPGETQACALLRELREELDVGASIVTRIGDVFLPVEVDIRWSLYHVTIHDDDTPAAKAHDKIKWADLDQAVKYEPCAPTTYGIYRRLRKYMMTSDPFCCGKRLLGDWAHCPYCGKPRARR